MSALMTMESINAAIAEVEKIPAPEYRGFIMSRATNAALRKTLDTVNDPSGFILTRTHGIEIHVREWMPSEIIIPVPWAIKTREQLEEFESRVQAQLAYDPGPLLAGTIR